jgi:glucose-6-phosphate isomerase
MIATSLGDLAVWKKLEDQAGIMALPENHLAHLLEREDRLKLFSLKTPDFFYDYSRQRVNSEIMGFLFDLAQERGLPDQFKAMMAGEKVNLTEKRAALHTATRQFSQDPVLVDGRNVLPEITEQREMIRVFSDRVRWGQITGTTGKPFGHVVVVGIGGSYLGTEFVSTALNAYSNGKIKIHYLSNVDVHNFGQILGQIHLESTLWVIVSKSYTTMETLANTHLVNTHLIQNKLNPKQHVVAVTAKGSPGDDPEADILASFHMFDFIGGRYSVTSAVGGLPLSLSLGFEVYERFLRGAEQMDLHAANAPLHENAPMIAALLSVWNNNFLNYPAQAIIPYASPLAKLAPHIQQLNMESNGKSVTAQGDVLHEPTGTIIFGEPGTNAQHSFFQLAHQGRPFPIDFIGVIRPQYEEFKSLCKGVTNHQELWANLLSQPKALALGKTDEDPAKSFAGNRPSSTLILNDLSPESVGRLLSFYEARTVFEAFVWGINPFDQFGVELGKTMASSLRNEMAEKNKNPGHEFKNVDPISRAYLTMLYGGNV